MTQIADLQIHYNDNIGRPYTVIGDIKTKVTSGAYAFLRRERTIEDANQKLREVAMAMGADAVINVTYDRGMSLYSWKALRVRGTAVRFDRHTAPVASAS
jgi:uncharacterized protein YbjQ (UPF0145 family)